jgi:hypothetical protein
MPLPKMEDLPLQERPALERLGRMRRVLPPDAGIDQIREFYRREMIAFSPPVSEEKQ